MWLVFSDTANLADPGTRRVLVKTAHWTARRQNGSFDSSDSSLPAVKPSSPKPCTPNEFLIKRDARFGPVHALSPRAARRPTRN